VAILLMAAGCVKGNRYSTYGPSIILYRGDAQVLLNCCTAAMGLMADELKSEMNLETTPDIKSSSGGFSSTGSGGKDAQRDFMSMRAGEHDFTIEIVQVDGYPATVILDCPRGDKRLAGHLVKLFANSHVKEVEKL
jgi:hypothetical protein